MSFDLCLLCVAEPATELKQAVVFARVCAVDVLCDAASLESKTDSGRSFFVPFCTFEICLLCFYASI